MKTKKVFEETARLGNEIINERQKLERLNLERLEMMNKCTHELVFKYFDNRSKRSTIDGNYFCPACGKIIVCNESEQILDSDFKESRIIPLMDISMVGTKEEFSLIRSEVYYNMDYYYNPSLDWKEIASKMESIIAEQQHEIKSMGLLRKLKRKL